MSRDYHVDVDARTVKHNPTGVVMHFEPTTDGGWDGKADPRTMIKAASPQFLAGLARRMGEAWANEIGKKK